MRECGSSFRCNLWWAMGYLETLKSAQGKMRTIFANHPQSPRANVGCTQILRTPQSLLNCRTLRTPPALLFSPRIRSFRCHCCYSTFQKSSFLPGSANCLRLPAEHPTAAQLSRCGPAPWILEVGSSLPSFNRSSAESVQEFQTSATYGSSTSGGVTRLRSPGRVYFVQIGTSIQPSTT